MTYPYDPGQPMFSMSIWTDDSKATAITSLGAITRIVSVSRHMALDEPYQFTIQISLADQYAQAGNLSKGHWVELSVGKTTRTMWAWGNIQRISKSRSGKTLTLELASSMIALSTSVIPGYQEMDPHNGFGTLTDYLNGVGTGKDQWGYLHGTGWSASWLDGTSGTNVTTPPGNQGHKRAASNATVMQVTSDLAGFYDFHFREGNDPRVGHTTEVSKLQNGSLVCGPMYDNSGLTIWGGQPLLTDMKTNGYLPSWVNQPNHAIAVQQGYAVVEDVQFEDDLTHIINCIWALGKDDPNLITLESLAGGTPSATFQGTAQNGWTVYTPPGSPASNARKYYIKSDSHTTYSGNSFYLIATQTSHGDWLYGVLNKTSSDIYGVYEMTYKEPDAAHPEDLLAASISKLEWNSSDVPSFTFTVRHPMTSSDGVPTVPKPGQKVTINYSGQMHDSIDLDQTSGSGTFGQYNGIGAYTYMDYPGVATSDPRYKKMTKCVGIDDEWQGKSYSQTLTMGRGKWTSKKWGLNVAKAMEKNLKKRHRKHGFKRVSFDHIPFLFSQAPDAWEDTTGKTLFLNPGAIAVSDVRQTTFFEDHHEVSFTATFTDTANYLDFWFAKDTQNGTTKSPNPGGHPYGVFRLAGTGSAQSCGFATTSDGTVFTPRGTVPANHALNANRRIATGTWRVSINWSSNRFNAKVYNPDTSPSAKNYGKHFEAWWNDKNPAGSKVLTWWGAIGWMLHGGSASVAIKDVHAKPHYYGKTPKGAISRTHLNTNMPGVKRYRKTQAQYTSALTKYAGRSDLQGVAAGLAIAVHAGP